MNKPNHLPEIPEIMKSLPIDDRGYPIPYFVSTREDGSRDFRFADAKKQINCIKFKKCWICGKPMSAGIYYIITGPIGRSNKHVSDPGMHEACARFSLFACPHMYFEKADRGSDRSGIDISQDPNFGAHTLSKPKELFMIKIDKYEHISNRTGISLVKFREISAEKFVYKNGILIKEN